MAPADRPERAAIRAGGGVIAFYPVFAAFQRTPASSVARHGRDALDEALSGPVRVLHEHYIARSRTMPGEGEAIEEDALTLQEGRRHAAAFDTNAPGAGESDERVEAGNGRDQAQETATELSRHIRL